MASKKHDGIRFGSNNLAGAFGSGTSGEANFIHGHEKGSKGVFGGFGSFESVGSRMQSHEIEFDYKESDGDDADDQATSFSNEHLPTAARLDTDNTLDQLRNEDHLKICCLEGQVKTLYAKCKSILDREARMMHDHNARRFKHQNQVATMQQTINELRVHVEELTTAANWVTKGSEPGKTVFEAWDVSFSDAELSSNPAIEATIVDKVKKLLEQNFGMKNFKKELETLILKTELEISKQRVAEATSQMEALRKQYAEKTSEVDTPKRGCQRG